MGAKLSVNLHRILTGHRQSVYALAKVDEERFISAGGDGFVVEWNAFEGEDGVALATIPEPVYSLYSHDNGILAGAQSGSLYAIKGTEVRKIVAHNGGIFRIVEWNESIITLGGDGVLMVWNWNFELLKTVKVSSKSLRSIAPFPGGLAVGCSASLIHLYNVDFTKMEVLEVHNSSVFAMEFIPQTNCLVSAGRDAKLQVYQIYSGEMQQEIAAHLLHIHDLKLSPNGNYLCSASMDKTIKIWDAENLQLLKVLDNVKFELHKSSVNALLWLNSSTCISASDDRSIGVWQVSVGEEKGQ
ncbi:MAG: hypothetical protein IT244_11850 [Bacteroidia bacterium]|nr:hypothetical protein [Bacteroidia bacterium]